MYSQTFLIKSLRSSFLKIAPGVYALLTSRLGADVAKLFLENPRLVVYELIKLVGEENARNILMAVLTKIVGIWRKDEVRSLVEELMRGSSDALAKIL